MPKQIAVIASALLGACLVCQAGGQTVYFIVGEKPGIEAHNESYVLPLSEPNDIAHARDLITLGSSAGKSIVVADIACGPDGINRDYLRMGEPTWWCWHVTEFVAFADMTIEILDGWPGYVNENCKSFGRIGFWGYTVVAELGTDLSPSCGLDPSGYIDWGEFAQFSGSWGRQDCHDPDWCVGSDSDKNGRVDFNDVAAFAGAWLDPIDPEPLWFDCWDCPTQCYGDTDCRSDGGIFRYPVSTTDIAVIVNVANSGVWPTCYCNSNYNPCADFDRDLDVDDRDVEILQSWLGVRNVPANCPSR